MTYTPRLPPAQFQIDGVAKAGGARAFAYLMEMGCRKSSTTLYEWSLLVEAKEIEDLLIIAPAGCYRNWTIDTDITEGEATKHLDQELRKRTAVETWKSGGSKANNERLGKLLATRGRQRILAVNVEALSRPGKARELCAEFLSRRKAMVVVDESVVIKGPSSECTKVVVNFAELAPYRRILSGLVTPNSPLDLYSQFEFLNWRILGQRSFFGFKNRYAVVKRVEQGGRVVGQRADGSPHRVNAEGYSRVHTANMVVGYRNEEELADRIAPHSYRVLKRDVLTHLPPKTFMPPREVEMTAEQARVYAELKAQATSQLDSGGWVNAQLPITLMLRLHQVLCGHVVDEEGVERDVKTNRVDALLSLLDQHPRKAIIWASYNHSIHMIADRLRREYGDASVAVFYGGNRSTRHEDEARFKGDPRCRWMVASQAAGGRGNNWTVADLTVYYASTHNLDHRLQSEERNDRDGQTLPVTVHDLVVPGTVDMGILRALREKIDMAAAITRDGWKQWVI